MCVNQLFTLSVRFPVRSRLSPRGVQSHLWIFERAGRWRPEAPCCLRVSCMAYAWPFPPLQSRSFSTRSELASASDFAALSLLKPAVAWKSAPQTCYTGHAGHARFLPRLPSPLSPAPLNSDCSVRSGFYSISSFSIEYGNSCTVVIQLLTWYLHLSA